VNDASQRLARCARSRRTRADIGGRRLITRKISAVAVCCSSDSEARRCAPPAP
jgi:hypothetical protein